MVQGVPDNVIVLIVYVEIVIYRCGCVLYV